MKNFQPGGLRNRKPDLGGRPQSDVNNYAPKKRFDGKRSESAYSNKKDVTLYKTTCTTCGAACEVPFRPDGKKPVLCRDCFAAKNAAPTNAANSNQFTKNELIGRTPERRFDVTPVRSQQNQPDYTLLTKQLNALETKVSQILELIQASSVIIDALPLVTPDSVTDALTITPTKTRKPKSTTPAVKKAAVKKKAQVAKKVTKKVAKKAGK